MERKSVIWNGYHFGDNSSPTPKTAPLHTPTPPVYTLYFTSEKCDLFPIPIMFCFSIYVLYALYVGRSINIGSLL